MKTFQEFVLIAEAAYDAEVVLFEYDAVKAYDAEVVLFEYDAVNA